jgi:type IV pilus biogenesis protein CpaD/CtpE
VNLSAPAMAPQSFIRIVLIAALAALASSCASLANPYTAPISPCDVRKASYECQIEQYQNVDV